MRTTNWNIWRIKLDIFIKLLHAWKGEKNIVDKITLKSNSKVHKLHN